MATEHQSQIGVGQPPMVSAQGSSPPSYDSIQPDQAKQHQQQPAVGAQLQQPLPVQQGVPYQAWPNQGRVYQPAPAVAQGPVQYIAVRQLAA